MGTGVLLINDHGICCPKRRRNVPVGPVRERLIALINATATALDCAVLALAVRPDHVHLFVAAPPDWAPNQLVGRFKGKSSRLLRLEYPPSRRLPSLWTRAYCCAGAGNVSAETIARDSAEQTTKGCAMRTDVYTLRPTRDRETALTTTLDTCRHLYNRALAERKGAREQEQRSVTFAAQCATPPAQQRENP